MGVGFVLTLLVVIPALVTVLLFSITNFTCTDPTVLSTTAGPAITILYVVTNVVTLLPLVVIVTVKLSGVLGVKGGGRSGNRGAGE